MPFVQPNFKDKKPNGAPRRYPAGPQILLAAFCFIAGFFFASIFHNMNGVASLGSQISQAEAKAALAMVKSNEPVNIFGKPLSSQQVSLKKYLQKIAPSGDVMVAISNNNLLVNSNQLRYYIDALKKLPDFTNWMVIGIDQEVYKGLQDLNVNTFLMELVISEAQKNTGMNHAVGALKYGIVKSVLEMGWNVFLSDVDIVVLQNPFNHLYRDFDLEGMSDGFDERTAYGYIDGYDEPFMGWGRFYSGTKKLAMNSGMFYIKSNERCIDLMGRLERRLQVEETWDQQIYNEELFFLPHGEVTRSGVSVRALDIFKFMNSRILFGQVRYQPQHERVPPVMIHSNSHPDKEHRMDGIIKHFIEGDMHALDNYPTGSEPGT